MNALKLKYFIEKYWILLILVAVKMILQFVFVNPIYDLHRDEYLHLDQAFHFSFGYISVPPFTSWIARIIYLFGGGIFWIRLFPALFGALTIVLVWLIVEETGGRLQAKILASILLVFSVLVRINLLFQPNSFDILAWTGVFYFLIKYINTQQNRWIIVLSILISLGLYNKYNIVFLLTGLLAGFLLTAQRTIFTKKIFYVAIALCLILFLPNIIWQIRNDFPVIHHMKALNDSQLVHVNRLDFLFDQLKLGLVGLLTLAAFWALAYYKPFKPYRFIGWTFVVVVMLYISGRAKSYYTIGLYPVLFALGSVYLEVVLKKWKAVVFPLLALSHIVVFLGILKYLMPYQNPTEIIENHLSYEKLGLLHWEDGKVHPLPQDFSDMLGWREMADKTLIAYQQIPENERKNTLVFCDNYGQTGAVNYYNRTKMPEAHSFATDYIYWLPDHKKIQNIVFVGQLPDQKVMEMFREYKLVGVVENEYSREKDTRIFLLLGAHDAVTEMFYKLAEKRKQDFDVF